MQLLSRRAAVTVFLSFALAYFLSALIRAITATLSPTLTQEFALSSGDLGLLAGGYFLGFALTQLHLGRWLDQYGPKRVLLGFLSVAVLGCLAFSSAQRFDMLLVARMLCGVGVSACLMAPLTGYRRWLDAGLQLRANSWMLMMGSLGMVASTLPVQWLMPLMGWRPIFWLLAAGVALSMALIALLVPAWQQDPAVSGTPGAEANSLLRSYAPVWANPYFRSLVPLGAFSYGGLVAMQTLWASPWMIRVAGYTRDEAATGLFWINVTMLASFWLWGMVNPWLARRGWHANRLITLGLPLSFAMMLLLILGQAHLGSGTALVWALFCMGSTFVSLAQPAVAMAFPPGLAGRALSAYNLVIFVGVFVVQWGIGLLVDLARWLGLADQAAFQVAMTVFLACCMASYAWFLARKPHNLQP